MSDIKIIKPTTRKEQHDFVRIPHKIYKNCAQYVPDLESDVRKVFQSSKNNSTDTALVQPFVAYLDGLAVGRIVGIINYRANEKWNIRCVRFSMIEFIDDMNVSRALLDAVAEWGLQQGMNMIQGPLGITDFDKEGMLVEDFHLTGSMNTIYNPEYYPRHMEALGFHKEIDWLQIRVDIPKDIPPTYARVAKYVKEMMGLRVHKLTNAEIRKGVGHKVFELFNQAYAPLFGFSAFSKEQIDEFINKYIRLIDKRLIPIVVNDQGELIGAAVTMASLTQAMQRTNGQLFPLGWYHLIKSLRWKHEDNVEMLLVAVRPDFQGYGVTALFFDDLIPIYNELGFKWAETGPQLEDNVKELSQWKPMKPYFVKRRRCYGKAIVKE